MITSNTMMPQQNTPTFNPKDNIIITIEDEIRETIKDIEVLLCELRELKNETLIPKILTKIEIKLLPKLNVIALNDEKKIEDFYTELWTIEKSKDNKEDKIKLITKTTALFINITEFIGEERVFSNKPKKWVFNDGK